MSCIQSVIIDSEGNTASAEILLGGEIETAYSFNGSQFILSERLSEAVLDPDEMKETIRGINKWWVMCQNGLNMNYTANSAYLYKIEETANNVQFDLKFGAVVAIDAKYKRSTGVTTFKGRDQLTLTPSEFQRFVRTLVGMLNYTV